MTWTLENLFGAGATYNGTNKTVTFDIDSLLDANGQPWSQSANPTASQAFAALLKHSFRIAKDATTDKTKGIVSQANFGESVTIETRDGQSQMYEVVTFRIYSPTPTELTSGIDPDNVL